MSSAFARPKTRCITRTAPAALVVGSLLGSLLLVTPATAATLDTTPPAAVAQMKVSADSSRVKLDWSSNSESDLAGYLVFRSTSAGGSFAQLTSAPRSASEYSDTSAPAGFPSYYRVVAVDKSGNQSAPVSATGTRRDGTKPAAPVSATVTRSGSSFVLDWADNAEADLAGYVVSRATSSGGSYTRLTTTPVKGSTFTDSGVPAGKTPYYKISAVDFSGNTSSTITVTVPDTTAPAAVRSLKVTTSTSSVKLDWSSNSESDLAGYHVYRSSSLTGAYSRLTTSPRSSSDYTDSTAPAGVPSYYRIVALDKSGNESVAVSATGTRKDGVAPAAPGVLTGISGTDGVLLDWADNTESDLVGYTVSRATSSGGTYTKLTANPISSSTYLDASAVAGVRYYYRVTAADVSGNLSSSSTVAAMRADTVAPGAVRYMKVSTDSTRVKLDWSSNSESDLVGYLVYRSATVDGTFTKLTATPVTSSEYSDTSAVPGTPYHYRVVAVDRSGNESEAVATSGTRRDTVAPAAVAALVAQSAIGGITLDWADNTEADVTGYIVSRAVTAGGSYTRLTPAPVTGSAFVDETAPVGATSYYRVTAVDASGNVSSPISVSAVLADTVAPAAPQQLAATGTPGGISLSWTKNAESDLAGYRISRSDSLDGEYTDLTSVSPTATTYIDATAPAEHAVFYRVVALDRSGNVSEAAAVLGIPADTIAPAGPAELVATGTEEGVTLDWADNSEADFAGYRVSRATAFSETSEVLSGPLLTEASTFADVTAVPGVAYRYSVVAVDRVGNASSASTAIATRIVVNAPIPGADVTVAQDGSGDFTTIAAAVAAAPANASVPFAIGIRPGVYRELITLTRSNVTLFGSTANASDVVISYDNASGTVKPDGSGTYGTSGSATVLIKGSNVTTKNLTIENSYRETGSGSEQAVALKTTGDRLVFDNVRLLGDQDTLYVDSPTQGALARSYFVNSYIEGDVDFIFGRGTAVFDRSTLKAATRGSATNNGYVTAASTDRSLAYGYLITDSTITSDAPAQSFNLGRPWQPSGDVNAIAQVVIRNTELPASIKSAAWTNMSTTFSWRDARFAEYQNTGPGAAVNADRPQLTEAEAAKYTKFAYLAGADGWNPTGQLPPADTIAPASPATPSAVVSDSKAVLSWTASTDEDLAGYNLYRSSTGVADASSTRVNTGLLTGTTVTDSGLTNDTLYSWVLTAVDRSGNESPVSAQVTGTPVGVPLPAHDILVAADGSGDYTTVQAALAAAPAGTAAKPTVIAVKAGTYRELITMAKNYVTVIGATGDASDVVLSYDNAAGTTNPLTGATYGTGASQSVLVSGSNITVRDLTIENAFDEAAYTYSGEQAVALKTTGDRLVFANVRLLGNQDTLLVDSPDAPVVARSYFTESYIQGDVDFIFGRGTAVFDRSTIAAMSRGSSSNNGYITAASTSDKNPYGFLITDSTITSNAPAGTFSLGRPWRGWSDGYTKNGVVYNSRGQVTVRDSVLPAAVRGAQPWADMAPNLWTDGRFSEYGNTGPGASANANRPQLTDAKAATATKWTYLAGSDGWNPTGEAAPVPVDETAPAAPAELTAIAGDGKAVLSWAAPADADVAGYNVYRSTADGSAVRVNGSALVRSAGYTDATPTNGVDYSYTVTAVDAAGNESVLSTSVAVTPAIGDATAPAAPAGISATLGKGSVTVAWSAVVADDLASYTVYRSAAGGEAAKVGSVTGTSFVDTTAVVGTTYSYTVTATDSAANESAASAAGSATPVKADVVVATDGSGDATTIQAAIDLLANNADYTVQGGRVILVKPGTYTGVVTSGNRYGVSIVGATGDAKDTVITAGGTGTNATVSLSGKGWSLKDLTVANTNPAGTQATALKVSAGDRDVFENVRFLGDGQVLQLSTANLTTFSRLYFHDVYVEGGADMLIGRAVAVFDDSTFRVLNRPGASITDSSIAAESGYGFLITGSTILTDGAAGSVHLGRPYGTQGKAQVVVRDTELGAGINTAKPWKDWDAVTTWTAGRFAEYRNTGAGAAIVDPTTRPQLSEADAAGFTAQAYLAGTDGWNPVK